MSSYLYRLARFAFRRRRLVLAVWLAAAMAAIAIAQASGGKTNDVFTIPGTEAQNAANVLSARLPAFSGGQSTIVFATTADRAKVTDPAARSAIEPAMAKLRTVPRVAAVADPFQSHLISQNGKVALGQVQWSAKAANVKDASLNAVKDAMKPVQADGVEVEYNGSVYPGWRTVISEVPELIGLIIAFVILMITFGAFAAAGMPFLPVRGLAAGASVTVALLIALPLLPAVLGFAGPKVAKFPRLPLLGARAERVARRSAADPDSSAGAGWGRFVVRHRVPLLIGGIAPPRVPAIPAPPVPPRPPPGAPPSPPHPHRTAHDPPPPTSRPP